MTKPIDIPKSDDSSSPDDSQASSFSSNNSFVVGSPKPKKKTKRCFICRKKLGLLPFVCECNQLFCSTHRHPEDHACTFDHRAKASTSLERNLIKVEGDRVQNRL